MMESRFRPSAIFLRSIAITTEYLTLETLYRHVICQLPVLCDADMLSHKNINFVP